ncbi:MAG TPA: M24 family metallopeptidase [Pseudolabrys sp.]|jgi:Xaa-Pro dipeptidase|nr:M24 family metallopeptidase [Pseudolabrys sp.]
MTPLPQNLARIVEAEYPRFSDAEMARRRAAVEAFLAEADCDHLVFCGANRFGSSVQWLTQWPVTAEAVGVLSPGKRDALFVQYVNHAPQARILADKAEVAWGGESSIAAAIDVLAKRGARENRVAMLGPVTADQHAALSAKFGKLTSLNRDYVRLRQVKSPEELDWLRIGAHFSDLGMAALRDGVKPGLNERELGDMVERTYVAQGATNVIHYIGVTSMSAPDLGVPRQFPRMRRVQAGDAVVAEITAAFWDHPGQVLRSFALGEPSKLYRDLHAAADAAFDAIVSVLKAGTTPAQVIEASGVIEQAGFTIIDDLLHGYGGGYLPPILGSKSRPAGAIPLEPFRNGQTVVVQPNVVTRDGKAGVQTGEMMLITASGVERFHAMPRGFAMISPSP